MLDDLLPDEWFVSHGPQSPSVTPSESRNGLRLQIEDVSYVLLAE
jgi:hypothetical protein